MKKEFVTQKKLLKSLHSELKTLQSELVVANKIAGIDEYITVKVKKDQAHFLRIKRKGEDDKAVGKFFIQIDITSKQDTVFVPISIASGKKPTGFIYQIEGTGESSISTANVACRGEGVSQVTIGTLLYSKIPEGKTASFKIQVTTSGRFAKTYKIIIYRINYKLTLNDARYKQYIKEIVGDSVTFS
jgi:hypothetical protein